MPAVTIKAIKHNFSYKCSWNIIMNKIKNIKRLAMYFVP